MVEEKFGEGEPKVRPQIIRYRDYRKFLEGFYHYKKSLRSGFSFRRFSQLVGISSPNYLQLVMKSQRNLSSELAARIAKVLGLSAAEQDYFCALVDLESLPEQERDQAQKRLLASIKSLVTQQIPKDQTRVLQEWYHLIIREMVLLPDFEPSGEWISQKLRGLVSEKEAIESLDMLLRTGFLKAEHGKYLQMEPVIDTGDAFQELAVLKMHSETLQTWISVLAETRRDHRELGLLTIPISSDKIPEFKKRIQRFQDEIIGWLQEEKNPDQIVQLGTYLIPMTKRKTRE